MGEDRMSHLVILMYHGLVRDQDDLRHIAREDRPYTLSLRQFESQLDAIAHAGIPVRDAQQLRMGEPVEPGVVISFDDGHASNAELALPALRARAMSACFFITTGFVGQRAGYCSWDQVRELAEGGMCLGAHGHRHRFLAGLDSAELETELRQSHELLSHHLGRAPRQMSFPGGRHDARAVAAARAVGFDVLHGSHPGSLDSSRILSVRVLPRMAMRPELDLPAFMARARADRGFLMRARAIEAGKALARGVLGHERYHRLYARFRA